MAKRYSIMRNVGPVDATEEALFKEHEFDYANTWFLLTSFDDQAQAETVLARIQKNAESHETYKIVDNGAPPEAPSTAPAPAQPAGAPSVKPDGGA